MLLDSASAMPQAYVSAFFHVMLLNVVFLAGAGAVRFKQMTKSSRRASDMPKRRAKAGTPKSPRYPDSVTLVESDGDGKAKTRKKTKSAADRIQNVPEIFPHLCNPIVMTARTPSVNILDGLDRPLPRASSTFTRKQRLPIPSFIPPEDEAPAAKSISFVTSGPPGSKKANIHTTADLYRGYSAPQQTPKISFKEPVLPPPPSSVNTIISESRQKLAKIFSDAMIITPVSRRRPLNKEIARTQDASGCQPPSTASSRTLKSSCASSTTRVYASGGSRDVRASYDLGEPIDMVSRVTGFHPRKQKLMDWDIVESDVVLPPSPTPVEPRRSAIRIAEKPVAQPLEAPKLKERVRAPAVQAAVDALNSIRAKRESAQSASTANLDSAGGNLDKKVPSQSRLAKPVNKAATEPQLKKLKAKVEPVKTDSPLRSEIPTVLKVKPSIDEPAVLESVNDILERIRARRASAQNKATTDSDPVGGDRDKMKRSQTRFSKLVDKFLPEAQLTMEIPEVKAVKKESRSTLKTPMVSKVEPSVEPVSILKKPTAKSKAADALKRASSKVSNVFKLSKKLEKPTKTSPSVEGLKVPANASAPPTRKDSKPQVPSAPPVNRRSTKISDFMLPPSKVNVPRERTAAPRVRMIPMKPKPPIWSPPRKVRDVFFSPKDEKKRVHQLPAHGLFWDSSPDRRLIRKLDERDYFITSTPRVNHAHYGGFSTSTPRPGVNTRRDTWHDFF